MGKNEVSGNHELSSIGSVTTANLEPLWPIPEKNYVYQEVKIPGKGNNGMEISSADHQHERHQELLIENGKTSEIAFIPVELEDRTSGNNSLASSSADEHEKHQELSIDIGILKEMLGPGGYNEKEIMGPVPGQCCIYRVPIYLRKINKEAYTPQVISIGPLHHGTPKLMEMEKQKLRYLSEFHKKKGKEIWFGFKKFIEENEERIRNCYAEYSSLKSCKFINIILLDAVFIVEFFLKKNGGKREKDFLLRTPCGVNAIARDLLLLENQLPYFVLENLYKQANYPETFLSLSCKFFGHFHPLFEDKQILHFTDLGRYFMLMGHSPKDQASGVEFTNKGNVDESKFTSNENEDDSKFKKGNEDESKSEEGNEGIKDIPRATSWLHVSGAKFRNGNEEQSKSKKTNEDESKSKEGNEGIKDIPCATWLHGSGVKFTSKKRNEDESKSREGNEGIKEQSNGNEEQSKSKKEEEEQFSVIGKESRSLIDIRCEYVETKVPFRCFKSFQLWFQELELQIPVLCVDDHTECFIRNLMALEMCHYPHETHVCNYIALMDDLIDTKQDVDLLMEKGIIVNYLGDNAAIAKMLNKLCLQIVGDESAYLDVKKKLVQHYNNRWNHTKAKLKMAYFGDLWTGTATVAAVILLLLTFLQTIFSSLQMA